MVEYQDGSIIAQLGIPDMTIPISYALSYPRHLLNKLPRLELEKIGHLNFEPPDLEKFKCLDLALKAIETGGTMPAVLNGANELAVASFLEGEIEFLDIPSIIEKCMDRHQPVAIENIGTVMEMDAWARQQARNMITSSS
jgi:1-deoxy-D-xylulose-5-phosphate reductoisomerase